MFHFESSHCRILSTRLSISLLAEQAEKERKESLVRQPAVLLSSCCRPHFWSKLTGFQNQFHLMWNPFALTARWKFLRPQLLLQKLVLQVVSHVTKTLPIVNGTCMIENTSGAGRGLFPVNFLSVSFC